MIGTKSAESSSSSRRHSDFRLEDLAAAAGCCLAAGPGEETSGALSSSLRSPTMMPGSALTCCDKLPSPLSGKLTSYIHQLIIDKSWLIDH